MCFESWILNKWTSLLQNQSTGILELLRKGLTRTWLIWFSLGELSFPYYNSFTPEEVPLSPVPMESSTNVALTCDLYGK